MLAWLLEQLWQLEDGRILVDVGVVAGGVRVDIVDVNYLIIYLHGE